MKRVILLLLGIVVLLSIIAPGSGMFYVRPPAPVFEGGCDDYLKVEFDYESYTGFTVTVDIVGIEPGDSDYFPASTSGFYSQVYACRGSEYTVVFIPNSPLPTNSGKILADYFIGNWDD